MRSDITTNLQEMIEDVKQVKNIPCAVGFGISKPEQVEKIGQIADGVIVGSAIVKLCEVYQEDCVPYVKEYIGRMKKAMK